MKLKLREIKLSYAQDLFNIIDTQRYYLGEWLPFVATTYNPEDTEDFIKGVINQKPPEYVIIADGKVCGTIGYKDIVDGCSDIGYWLSQDYQGKGIVTTLIKQLIDKGFNEYGLKKLTITVAVGNIRSQKIPLKCGFSFKELVKNGEQNADGSYNDLNIYELHKTE